MLIVETDGVRAVGQSFYMKGPHRPSTMLREVNLNGQAGLSHGQRAPAPAFFMLHYLLI